MGQQSIMLKTPLVANTGYGHDGFSLARGFHEAGLDVRLMPVNVTPPLPMPVAQLLVKGLDIEFDYILHHVDPQSLGLTPGEMRAPGKKIAWSMWEFTRLTEEVSETFTEQLAGYDLLVAYDEVSAQAFRPHAEAAGVPIKILQGGYWSQDWEGSYERDWEGTFRFCMAGQLGTRKNPWAAAQAFREVHEEFPATEFLMKTNVQSLHPKMEEAYPGLKIHYELWNHQQMRDFYARCHTYVAPSWGEGKNLPALEAQTSGIPVIYSDFGGHRQWGDSSIGWPVGGEIGYHAPEMGSIRVDHDQLVSAMKDAVKNRSKTKMMGDKASRLIPDMCDWGVVLRRFLDIVR